MSDKLPSPTKDGSDGGGNDEGGKVRLFKIWLSVVNAVTNPKC